MLFQTEAGQRYLEENGLVDKMDNATHIAWATGGVWCLKIIWKDFINKEKILSNK